MAQFAQMLQHFDRLKDHLTIQCIGSVGIVDLVDEPRGCEQAEFGMLPAGKRLKPDRPVAVAICGWKNVLNSRFCSPRVISAAHLVRRSDSSRIEGSNAVAMPLPARLLS